jgi:putative salt-induced outer membrane protein YdiY
MFQRPLWLGLLAVVAGAAWACAQPQAVTFSLWDFASPPPAVTSNAESPPKSAADDLDKRLYGPEIWRLPPVGDQGGGNIAGAAVPPALTMPPMETIPAPAPYPSAANAPAALSGVLSIDEPLKIRSPEMEVEKLWDGMFDLGLDGSEGNSETFNFRFGFHAARKTESNILTLGLDYNKSTAQTVPTANRLFFEGRFEWLIHDSRWSWFVHETIEYDEFQSFDVRDTSDIGLGYRLIKSDSATLIGRFGGGFSHEYGGPENGLYIPEMVYGLQLEQKISKRQKFLAMMEYAPDVSDFLRYRVRSQAALEVLLDEDRNLSLRMGVLEVYNSHPNGARPNDLDYAVVLLWKF